MLWHMKKSEMQKRHVLFQEEDKDSYVSRPCWTGSDDLALDRRAPRR